jgi:hypothetical protein
MNHITDRAAALAAVKALKVGQNSISIAARDDVFVVVKRRRNEWGIGELFGDWLTGGTAEEVVARAFDGKKVR